ncbi:MAG: EamA family transporter [Candidatus Gracilibacteria bacterium]|nr:EamA family transporter [Candidatus Gracilibacteria bacterium]MDD2908621.1 EamA family transporter [Candidatus Gracilibacteria bacterium]
MGYFFITLGVIFFALTNISDKFVSKGTNKNESLLLRYIFAIISILLIFLITGIDLNIPELKYSIILIFTGVLAYLINKVMYIGLKEVNTGKFFMVGYSYLIFLFILNIFVYGKSEILSTTKTIIAMIFIFYILYLTYKSSTGKDKNIFKGIILALICSIGWTIMFFSEGYFIKIHLVSPLVVMFLVFGGSLITGLVFLFLGKEKTRILSLSKKDFIIPSLGGIFVSLGSAGLLFSYKYIQLNIANVLSLSELFVTTIMAMIILKEKHSKKEIEEIIIGIIILMVFVGIK